jgi:hypothetical protein
MEKTPGLKSGTEIIESLIERADLCSIHSVIGRRFILSDGHYSFLGTITGIDNANDDGFVSLSISNKRFRGDLIEALEFQNGTWRLVVSPSFKMTPRESMGDWKLEILAG